MLRTTSELGALCRFINDLGSWKIGINFGRKSTLVCCQLKWVLQPLFLDRYGFEEILLCFKKKNFSLPYMLIWLFYWKKMNILHLNFLIEMNILQLPKQLVRWTASMRGRVKINWDAAVKKSHQTTGIGIVIHDYQGEIMVCLCSSQPFLSHLIVAKYIALRRVVTFCIELGFVSAQFEVDSQILINAINREAESKACGLDT